MRANPKSKLSAVALAVTQCLCLSSSRAQEGPDGFKWIDPPVSGAFDAASSWAKRGSLRPGPPNPGDAAIFPPGTYTVTCNGAATAYTTVTGNVTFVGSYDVGNYGQGSQVVLRGAAFKGGPFGIGDESTLLVDGSELTMNGFTFGNFRFAETRLTGINGAQIKSSGLAEGEFLPPFRLEGGSTWQHTGELKVTRCFLTGGSLVAADTLTAQRPELDGGRLKAGRLNGGGQMKNGSTVTADTASLNDWLLDGGGNSMQISGSTVPGLIYADISIKSGATFSAGALADNAWYTVDGSGSTLAVAGDITSDGPQKVTVLNQGQGSAATLTRANVIVSDPGSLFTFATRAEDSTLLIQNGGRINGGGMGGPSVPGRRAGCDVSGAGSALVLSGNLALGLFGSGGITVSDGGRAECEKAFLNGGLAGEGSDNSVFGVGSSLLARTGMAVGVDSGTATLNLGNGGRVEVRGALLGVGIAAGCEGKMDVDGGSLPPLSTSALDARQVGETGIGTSGKGKLSARGRGRILTGKLTVGVTAGSDGTVEVIGAGTILEAGGTLQVGQEGMGQLQVLGFGGLVTAPEVIIGAKTGGKGTLGIQTQSRLVANTITVGDEMGSDGMVEAKGAGATLEARNTLEVGRTGTGRLTLLSGSQATAQDVLVGSNSGANLLRLTGAGSMLTVTRSLHVGETGAGQLTIEQGAQVVLPGLFQKNTAQASVGYSQGASGTVTVSGVGSKFSGPSGALIVGVEGHGTLNVSEGGEVNFIAIAIGGGPGASGVATVSGAGSTVRSDDFIDIGGTSATSIGQGEMTVSAGGLLQPRFALRVFKPGTLRLTGGAAIVGQTNEAAIPGTVLVANLGKFYLGGRMTGSVKVRPGGTFLPGSSPGKAAIEGDLTLAEGTALELELGGTGAGLGYDQIEATGTVTLAGHLDLVFRDGFAPTDGQVFDVVKGGTVVGSFSAVNVRGLAPGFTYNLATTGGNTLRFTATKAGVATTQPELSIAPAADGYVVVSWPDYITGWTLQQSAGLQSASWQPLAAPGNTVTVPTAAGAKFFRLIFP